MSLASNTSADEPGSEINLRWFGTWSVQTVVFVIIALIFSLNLLPRTFWAENEAYYALGADNVLDGHFLVPVIYDTTLADKPPLMFWYISLISLPFGGVTEFTARLANLIPAYLMLLLVYWFARSFGHRAALLSSIVLATSHEFYEVAFEVNTDILLTTFLLISWIAMYRLLEEGFSWKRWALLWIPMGLGMLTKGPVAPVLSGLIAMAFAFPRYGWREGWRRLLSLRPFTGAVVCFLPFALWCAVVYAQYGRQPLDVILLRHNVQRFVDAFDHVKPWYYYFYTLPIVMLPWTVFIPLVAIRIWRAKRAKLPLPAWQTFALAVIAVGFVLFSWSSSKRAYYMLPLMPWISMLIGFALSRIGEAKAPANRTRAQRLVNYCAAGMLAVILIYIAVGYRLLDKNRSISDLTSTIANANNSGEPLILYADEDPRIMFYLPERMTYFSDTPDHQKQLTLFLAKSPQADVISMKRSLKELLRLSPVPLYVETSADYRDNRYYVLTTERRESFPQLSRDLIGHLKQKEKRELDS